MPLRNHVRLTRRCTRRLSRPLVRRTTRPLGGRGPNYLAQALTAFRRSARAHRQLIKLAPEQFDHAVRDRLAGERVEEDRKDAEMVVALARVYGSEAEAAAEMHRARMHQRGGNGAETGRFARRKQEDIAQWESEWELWLALGREAFDRHEQRTPHRRLSLSTIARLLELASTMGRLSLGCAP